MELMKLTQTIKLQEEALLEISKNHETAVQRRNFLYVPNLELTPCCQKTSRGSKYIFRIMFVCVTYSGIQLLEHEEVLLDYYEKANVHGAAITNGNVALENMEKEMRDLQLAINEEKRQIELKKVEVPLKKRMEGEITTLQIEVGKVTQDKTHTHPYHRP